MRIVWALFLCIFFTGTFSTLSGDEAEALMKKLGFSLIPKGEIRVILEPRQRTTLAAQVESTVELTTRALGESFYEGELLVYLDDTSFVIALMRAQALYSKAQKELEVRKELFADDVASRLELAEAESAAKVAHADVLLAQKRLEHCRILAPYHGKVIATPVDPYEMVNAGQPVLEIVDDEVLIAKFLLSSQRLSQIHIGQTIRIIIEETQSQEEATITHISAVIDPTSSMLKVEAEIDNADERLRAGMVGYTHIEGESIDD